MKALSLWQPWASAIAVGAKRIETRGWPTRYRGQLLIHAAKRPLSKDDISLNASWTWCGVLGPAGVSMGGLDAEKVLPFGALIAFAELVECRPTNSFTVEELDTRRMREGERLDICGWTERMLGDFAPGRFGWVLENVRPFKPIMWRGMQGLFEVPDEVVDDRVS